MQPFSLGVTTLVQGLYTLVWFIVLLDVASPTFDLDGLPHWTGIQAAAVAALALTAATALGVVMHTVSRGLFHRQKQAWASGVLASDAVRERLAALDPGPLFPGAPSYEEVLDPETPERSLKAGAYMHGIEFRLMTRAPIVHRTIQVYRDQYRLARSFVLPSAAFAFILPFWEPVAALDGAGSIGPFPIIRSQLFLLAVLAAAVSYVAFRERAHRYAAAKVLAFVTLEGMQKETAG